MQDAQSCPMGAQAVSCSPLSLGWGLCKGTAKVVLILIKKSNYLRAGELAHVACCLPSKPGHCLPQAYTVVDVIWQGALGGAERCKSATCTSPACARTYTSPPLETGQLGRRRNIYLIFLINRFPDMKHEFLFAAIGDEPFNIKNFIPEHCATELQKSLSASRL